MMVITVGVTLLLMATVLFQGTKADDQKQVLQDFARDLTERILADPEVLQQEGVLRYSSLYLLGENPLPNVEAVTGYQVRLLIMDQSEGNEIVLAHGLVPEKVALLVCKQTPIGLALSLNEVHPAILEVLVW
jgi:hypothetical protein